VARQASIYDQHHRVRVSAGVSHPIERPDNDTLKLCLIPRTNEGHHLPQDENKPRRRKPGPYRAPAEQLSRRVSLKPMPRIPYVISTEAQYWIDLQLLSTEIEDAVTIFHTAEEMNRLALTDAAILRALNREPLFWQGYRSTCQTALFMTMGRIFDRGSDTHSIHKIIDAALNHWRFFSRQSLRNRRTLGGGEEPQWLNDFIAAAWEPSCAADLEFLRAELAPHTEHFGDVYRPIRDAVIGHRLMTNDQAAVQLFPNTNREQVGRILDFLHGLIGRLIHLYNNGTKPVMGQNDFTDYNQRVRSEVQNLLGRAGRLTSR
jgi:hypothetical protein